MRTAFSLCLFLLIPCLADAEPLIFRVTGVAADDTLNVRAEPSGSSADIGDLAHDARGIEIAGTDASGNWGSIIWEEGNAWVAMRYLTPDTVEPIGDTALPAGLLCAGAEPFWSLRLSSVSATFQDISGAVHVMSLASTRVAEGRPKVPVQINLSGATAGSLGIVSVARCSDGMSERTYPWTISYILSSDAGQRFLAGCCHLPFDHGFN